MGRVIGCCSGLRHGTALAFSIHRAHLWARDMNPRRGVTPVSTDDEAHADARIAAVATARMVVRPEPRDGSRARAVVRHDVVLPLQRTWLATNGTLVVAMRLHHGSPLSRCLRDPI
jgi:hypothetical protein